MVAMSFETIHDWRPTGKTDAHVEFPTKTQGVKRLVAAYYRCRKCKAIGFCRPGSQVIFTWEQEDGKPILHE